MDVNIVILIATLSILVIETELSFKIIKRWEFSYIIASVIYYSELTAKEKEVVDIQKHVKKDIKCIKLIQHVLPIALTLEIGHIALQEFQWYSLLYEWIPEYIHIPSGLLNKLFLIGIILLIFLFYIIKVFKIKEETLLEYIGNNKQIEVHHKLRLQTPFS